MFYTRLSDKTAHIAVFVVCLFFLSLARHILPAVLHVCPLSMLSIYQIRFSSDFPDKMKNKEFACIELSHLSGRRNNRRSRERKNGSMSCQCPENETERLSIGRHCGNHRIIRGGNSGVVDFIPLLNKFHNKYIEIYE